MASPTPSKFQLDFQLSFAIADETKMFNTYPMVTSTIIGNNPVNILRTKVEQRNAIRDAIPQEVKQNPWRWDNVSFPK